MGCAGSSPYNIDHNWHKTHHDNNNGIVAITVNSGRSRQAYCTGVVLTPDVILTAGHCTNPLLHGQLYITYGCDNIESKHCTHVRVLIAVPHPNHKENGPIWNDVGVIKPMESITDVKPITLANIIEEDSIIYLSGFGQRHGKSGILYAGKSKINHFWLYEFETYLNGQNGPCAGDSGSPAFDEYGNVVGILSRSVRDISEHCGGLSKYTIPIMYKGWLNSMIEILEEVK